MWFGRSDIINEKLTTRVYQQKEEEMKNIPSSVKVECFTCNRKIKILRNKVTYWPDCLWAGKVSATFSCPKCKEKTGAWAHDLPSDWQQDWPEPKWESYNLPILLDSCYLSNIKPRVFKDSLKPFNIKKRTGLFSDIRSALADWISPK